MLTHIAVTESEDKARKLRATVSRIVGKRFVHLVTPKRPELARIPKDGFMRPAASVMGGILGFCVLGGAAFVLVLSLSTVALAIGLGVLSGLVGYAIGAFAGNAADNASSRGVLAGDVAIYATHLDQGNSVVVARAETVEQESAILDAFRDAGVKSIDVARQAAASGESLLTSSTSSPS